MNRELVELARGDRSLSLTYLVLVLCSAVMVVNVLREAFHLRARAPQVAAAIAVRAEYLANRSLPSSPHTNLTTVPVKPSPSGRHS